MALFRRLFGGRGDDAYARGIALFEAGQTAEALDLLRPVFAQDPGSPRGSLAGFYLRQGLMTEGRRRLQRDDAVGAVTHLDEAARLWPDFPDLHFLAGSARGLAGAWEGALASAHQALRRNGDYCEARLLEACALQELGRVREAAASLTSLAESGRRVDHQILRRLDLPAEVNADLLPLELLDELRRTAVGDDVKQRLAEAVARCQAGQWDAGLATFDDLVATHPRFPDIRAKQAAALYQAGRRADALAAAEAALDLNERYRTAVSLKGLILAEQGAVVEARAFLVDAVPRLEGTAGRHEELFLAYLRGVVALLSGHPDECREFLAPWADLPRQFARAALLQVACDHLDGQAAAAGQRLEELGEIWTADTELRFIRVALLLDQRQWSAAEALLERWPTTGDGHDARPLLLRARLDLARGREPVWLEIEPEGVGEAADAGDAVDLHPAAWRQVLAQAHLLAGDAARAEGLLMEQLTSGHADEETGRLLLAAAAITGSRPPADLAGRIGGADSWGPDLCRQLRHQGTGEAAEAFVCRRWRVRPDHLAWSWLSAAFWLGPVRRWLA